MSYVGEPITVAIGDNVGFRGDFVDIVPRLVELPVKGPFVGMDNLDHLTDVTYSIVERTNWNSYVEGYDVNNVRRDYGPQYLEMALFRGRQIAEKKGLPLFLLERPACDREAFSRRSIQGHPEDWIPSAELTKSELP